MVGLVAGTAEFEYVLEDFNAACRALRRWINHLEVEPGYEVSKDASRVKDACVHGVLMHDWWLGKKVDMMIGEVTENLAAIDEIVKAAGVGMPLHCYTCVAAGLELEMDGTRRRRWSGRMGRMSN